jgi:hypothetical protein
LGPEERFAIGQPVPRTEDPILVRGEGHYTDDVSLPGQAYCVMVRSPYAHGVLRGIDTEAAKAMPGVLKIYTGADLIAAGFKPLPDRQVIKNRDGSAMLSPIRHALTVDKVRYVGDPVAAVVAETAAEARDAAEAVILDIDPLPAVTDLDRAPAPDAPQIHDGIPANIGVDFHFGDSEAVAAAFAKAHHVTRLTLRSNRIVVNAMEPRSGLATYDAEREHCEVAPLEILQHGADPGWTCRREAVCGSVVSKRTFDLNAQLDHGHQRKLPSEFLDRRKVPLESRWERGRDFVLGDTHRFGGVAERVFDHHLVAALAEDDSDGRLVVLVP